MLMMHSRGDATMASPGEARQMRFSIGGLAYIGAGVGAITRWRSIARPEARSDDGVD